MQALFTSIDANPELLITWEEFERLALMAAHQNAVATAALVLYGLEEAPPHSPRQSLESSPETPNGSGGVSSARKEDAEGQPADLKELLANQSLWPGSAAPGGTEQGHSAALNRPNQAELRALFDSLDKNGDGVVNRREVRPLQPQVPADP